MKKFIDLDVSYGNASNNGEFVDRLTKETKKYDVSHSVNIFDGPAGGNPEVRFYGTQENLEKFMLEWYFGGDEGKDQYIDLYGMPENKADWFEDVTEESELDYNDDPDNDDYNY